MAESKDCKVCEKLMKEKHRHDVWWKVCAIIFLAFAVVLAILYFGSGAVVTETHFEIENSGNDNTIEGDGNIIVGGTDNIIDGKFEKTDYTPIVCITIVASTAVLVAGGIVIANHHKKDD